jgi:GT2 family glycosyltransferase
MSRGTPARTGRGAPTPERLLAPVAVRRIDAAAAIVGMDLGRPRDGGRYRGLAALVERDGRPVGFVTVPAPGGRVGGARLREEVERLGVLTDPPAGRPGPRPPGTVIVTTCNSPGPLGRCIDSVLDGLAAGDRVLVVENRPVGSRVARALQERYPGDPRVGYVEESRPGLGRARNAALAACGTEFIAFTDDDVIADAAWSRRLFDALWDDPEAAVVTGLIVPLALETPSQVTLEEFAGFAKGFELRRFHMSDPPDDPLFPFAAGLFGSGANLACRTAMLRGIGGYDDALGTGTPARGGEDLDLFTRAILAGHALVYEPGAVVWHEHPDSPRRLRRQAFGYGAGLSAVLTKQLLFGRDRRDLLRRVPAGLRFLASSDSRKNERKGPSYPRHLTAIELGGMLVGPIGYLRSLRAARRADRACG